MEIWEVINITQTETQNEPLNSVIADEDLQRKLEQNRTFEFELDYDRKKLVRNGLLLMIVSGIIGAGLGTLLVYVIQWSGVSGEFSLLGIGAGIGAAFGILLGTILIIAMKTSLVEGYGAGYGIGLGTNVFIGAIIGTIFGAIVGAIFGLVIEATNYTIETDFSYALYGTLVWIVLGLNIGVLVGLLASFGIIRTGAAGIFAGALVGVFGMLAIFGDDVIVFAGLLAGIISGAIIGAYVKFAIKASVGPVSEPECCLAGVTDKVDQATQTRRQRYRRRRDNSCWGGYYYYPAWWYCDWDSGYSSRRRRRSSDCDCGDSDYDIDDECGGILFIALVILVIIPLTILLISGITWLSKKASLRFGESVKRGALTAFGASLSILLIIGSNISLTYTFHDWKVYIFALIGAALATVFVLIILGAQLAATKYRYLKITPEGIVWRDNHSKGNIAFSKIEMMEYELRDDTADPKGPIDEYVWINLTNGLGKKVDLDCWLTPGQGPSSQYIQTIISYYAEQALAKERLAAEEALAWAAGKTDPTTAIGQSETDQPTTDTEPTITPQLVEKVNTLIGNKRKVSVTWLATVTAVSEETIREIVIYNLAKEIVDGFVIRGRQQKLSSRRIEITPQIVAKVDSLIDNKKKVTVSWLAAVTGLNEETIREIVIYHLSREIVNGVVVNPI